MQLVVLILIVVSMISTFGRSAKPVQDDTAELCTQAKRITCTKCGCCDPNYCSSISNATASEPVSKKTPTGSKSSRASPEGENTCEDPNLTRCMCQRMFLELTAMNLRSGGFEALCAFWHMHELIGAECLATCQDLLQKVQSYGSSFPQLMAASQQPLSSVMQPFAMPTIIPSDICCSPPFVLEIAEKESKSKSIIKK